MRGLQSRILLCLALVVVLPGCGSSDDESESATPATAAFDGAYQTEGGPVAWYGFAGGGYVAWSGDAACSDFATAAPSCAESGHFTTDATARTISLTSDAGRVRAFGYDVLTRAARDSVANQVAPASFGLVESPSTLVSQDVATSAKLIDSSGATQVADVSTIIRRISVTCRVIGLILHPPAMPIVVPTSPTTPPAITSQQCTG